MPNILVIDDDRSVRRLIEGAFRNLPDHAIHLAETATEGLQILARQPIDVVLLDVMLPDMSGLEAFQQVRALSDKLPVIFITMVAGSETAIEAMKLGAVDYLLKPLDLECVRSLVERTLHASADALRPELRVEPPAISSANASIIGQSPQMQDVYKAIGRVAPQNVTVLVRGESGTGKELIARAIYQHSPRSDKNYLAVNCAALTDSLLESELFGHEKGSFTGAVTQRVGKFEQCDGGTLFLDEVGDMSPVMQSKVLRVLQNQQFERVGGVQTISTDVRIIAATNRNLERMVANNEFREDLYYRLNGYTIELPPLRHRRQDVLLLLEHFFCQFRQELGKEVRAFSPKALDVLLAYDWPGNIRQLQSVVRQALVRATGPMLLPEFFPREIFAESSATTPVDRDEDNGHVDFAALVHRHLQAGSTNLYHEATLAMEQVLLTHVLRWTQGNQSKAAEMLGITRGSVRKKIRTLGINIEQSISLVHTPAS